MISPRKLSSQANAIVDCGLHLAIMYIISTHIKPAVRCSTEVYFCTIMAIFRCKISISRITVLRALHSSMFSPTNNTLPPLSPQPPLESTSIQPFRHQPFSSLPPRRSPEIPVARWILHQILHFPRLRAILPLANYSRFMSPPRKNARSSLVAMSDADLEGVIVHPSNQGTSTTMILLLEDLK